MRLPYWRAVGWGLRRPPPRRPSATATVRRRYSTHGQIHTSPSLLDNGSFIYVFIVAILNLGIVLFLSEDLNFLFEKTTRKTFNYIQSLLFPGCINNVYETCLKKLIYCL